MLSPEGRCKTLDASADGYVRAEACGALMLERQPEASRAFLPRSGATAISVLSGSAVNQDGRSSSLTAPNGPAQQQVIRQALALAGIEPLAVSNLQLHGTGRQLLSLYI